MRQLFNKSGTIMVFFASTFFLCTFLISMFLNARSSDIFSQFSEDAEYVVIRQEPDAPGALTYADVAKLLDEYSLKGAVQLDMGGKNGLMLYNYTDKSNFSGIFGEIDIDSPVPQAIIQSVYEPYCMPIDGKPTISLVGKNHEVVGLDIYSAQGSYGFICNIAGLSDNTTIFLGITTIIDNDKKTINEFKSALEKLNETVTFSAKNISDAEGNSGLINLDTIIVIVAILLIGLLLLVNSGVFTASWVRSKKTEITARRICGATGRDIKKMVFIKYTAVCLTGVFIGFLITFVAANFTGISYYLGKTDPLAGFVSALFIILVGAATAYEQSGKFSGEQIADLRRE